MARILGLDYGDKRIGVSLSDPLRLIASPHKVLKNEGISKLLKDLEKIINEKTIDTIVIGLPINLKGNDTSQTLKVRRLKSQIETLNVKTFFEDERLSSAVAKRSMINQRIKTGHNKSIIDKRAASIILQQFLNKENKWAIRKPHQKYGV